jgi:hypothetical protein
MHQLCTSSIRCKTCYNYGHVSRSCLTHRRTKIFHRKSPARSESVPFKQHGIENSSSPPPHHTPSPSLPPSPLSPPMAVEHTARLSTMANNLVDPHALVPHGFVIYNHSQEEDTPQRVFAFLITSVQCINEDVAISVLAPEVDLMDFPQAANAIRNFIVNNLHLRVIDIYPSGLGAATVTIASCRDRQVAMGAPHHMEPYWPSFIPHDAGANLCHLALDRSCWLMLVNFLLDHANEHCIASALNSFCNLVHWHLSSNKARQIVIIKLHSLAHIPPPTMLLSLQGMNPLHVAGQ